MNKIFILILFCLSLNIPSFSQDFIWATRNQHSVFDRADDICVDSDGNVYMSGSFSNYNHYNGPKGSFLEKYNQNGVLQWSQMFLCKYGYFEPKIALDSNNNVYFISLFYDTLSFQNIVLTENKQCVFTAKFNSSGQCLWAEKMPGISSETDINIQNNYLIISGNYSTTQIGNFILPDTGYFIAKYNISGSCIWAKRIADRGYISEITNDVYGNIFFASIFYGTYKIDTGNTSITLFAQGGGSNGFIAKFDSSGTFEWANQIIYPYPYQTRFHDIAVDNSGNSYITGFFSKSITFDNITLNNNGQQNDLFVAKYNSTGNVQWAKQSNTSDQNIASNTGNGICVNNSGVFITGSFQSDIAFDGISLTSNASDEMFLAKYDFSGNVIWAQKTITTGNYFCKGSAIYSDNNGNIYIGGKFYGVTDFGNQSLTSNWYDDIFITKISDSTSINSIDIKKNEIVFSFNIYPNPAHNSFTLSCHSPEPINNLQLEIKNTAGQVIYSNCFNSLSSENCTIDVGNQPRGIYFIEITAGEGRAVKKIILH